MDVLVLIDRLEELVEDARSFPGFGNTAMVDRDAAFDIIDQMRQTIPEELKQARWIVKERQAMLDEARSESDRIIRSAQDEAEKTGAGCRPLHVADVEACDRHDAAA